MPVECTIISGQETMSAAHCMPNPWVSLRFDQLYNPGQQGGEQKRTIGKKGWRWRRKKYHDM
jgi:hypothetical protein